MKTILLTNDDGYYSKGLVSLKKSLSQKYKIVTVAPEKEQSAVSMSLTLNNPLKIRKIDENNYAVSGTPADCINLAMQKILTIKPDFVVSGMNMGENLSDDIFFSGTCGGAYAAHLYDIPALAVSLIPDPDKFAAGNFNFKIGTDVANTVIEKLIKIDNNKYVYNLNIPFNANGKIEVTSLGKKRYRPDIIERIDPRGNKYYWIGTGAPQYNGLEGTDVWAVNNKLSSLTVLEYDLNSIKGNQILKRHLNEKN